MEIEAAGGGRHLTRSVSSPAAASDMISTHKVKRMQRCWCGRRRPSISSNLHVNDRWWCAWNGQELFQIEAPQHFHNIDNNKSALDGTKTWSGIEWCLCCNANMKDLQQTQQETHQGVTTETHKQRIHWDPDLTQNILIIFNKHHLVANSGVRRCYKSHQFQISGVQTWIFRFSLFHSLFIWRLLMIP